MHLRPMSVVLLMISFLVAVLAPTILSIENPAISQTLNSASRKEVNPQRKAEAEQLFTQGQQQYQRKQFREALQNFEKASVIYREIGDRNKEAASLNNSGLICVELGKYDRALEFFQPALSIFQEISNPFGQGITLNNIGAVFSNLGKYPEALKVLHQSLAIHKETDNPTEERKALNNIAEVHHNQGEYLKALEYYQQALVIAQTHNDLLAQGGILSNIAGTYNRLGRYAESLIFYEKALEIRKKTGDNIGEGKTLNNVALVYLNLGQPAKALDLLQQALAVHKKIQTLREEASTLSNIGVVYDDLKQYSKSLGFYQQALAIQVKIGDRQGQGTTLAAIGSAYQALSKYPEALETFQQASKILQKIGDRSGLGATLNNTGRVYERMGKYPQALEHYQQALVIRKAIGDREGLSQTLNNIGEILKLTKQTELAIVFYKHSVSIYEQIRGDLKLLPREQQESYTKTVEDTYRTLANLLLRQDRVLEAQQVLDLLKVQELDLYLRNVRGGNQLLIILQSEAEILKKYDELQASAIQLGQELTELRQIPATNRSPQQQQRIDRLVALEEDINAQFNNFIKSNAVQELAQRLSSTARDQTVNLEDLNRLRSTLQKLNAVMLYPLVLNDSLELIITTPNTPPIRRTVRVKKKDLNTAIVQFRQALQDPTIDAKVPAQQLYEWLIKPLEADLKQAKIDSIIYSPDGQLRYIPLAALYDGQKWLTQRYKINNITARSLTDFNRPAQSQLRVLSGAFVQGSYKFEVGGSSFSFAGLPFAGKEVDQVATLIPGGTKLVDKAFSLAAIKPKLNEYSIVHFATHGAFVPGKPQDSFLLFGNGDRPTLQDIQNWSLQNVDLVVLSACETGIGGKLGSGEEILGLGYQFQRAGARATIASLWKVDDGGTQALMSSFYAALKGKISKSEALREAQIALIQQGQATTGDKRASIAVVPNSNPTQTKGKLDHPYYWAPFILIGNGF